MTPASMLGDVIFKLYTSWQRNKQRAVKCYKDDEELKE
jgi:hypothetical protein